MLGRRRNLGAHMRHGLEPMAARLGLDVSRSFFEPPTTPEAQALFAYRIGQNMLMLWGNPATWPSALAGPKLARRCAKLVHDSVLTDGGRSGVSLLTQGLGRDVAGQLRQGASELDGIEAGELLQSAERSDRIADVAGEFWPVRDPDGALSVISEAEANRAPLPVLGYETAYGLPRAELDSYFQHARVVFGALALALGPVPVELSTVLYAPVQSLDVEVAAGMQVDWTRAIEVWAYLLLDEPVPYSVAISPPS